MSISELLLMGTRCPVVLWGRLQVQFEGVMPAYLAAREDKGMFGIRKTSGAAKAVATGVPAWIKVHATEYVMHLTH